MQSAQLPINEEARLKELYSLDILDTENEVEFDDLVQLASHICKCEVCIIFLVDENRTWFKAKKGLAGSEAKRSTSFCAHAILEEKVFIVEDALNDSRFWDNPSVTSGFVKFYAGAQIQSENKLTLGTICVVDSITRRLTEDQLNALAGLARHAGVLIELKRKNKLLKELALKQQLLKEKAEKASKAQEQFLSTMSHEIRTPLNGIMGIIDFLSQNSPRQDQVEDLEFLKSSSENLLHIVNDILDFNKIESGTLKIEQTAFSMREVILGIEKIHQLKAKQKAIQFKTFVDSKIPDVLIGDPTRIKQVLNNLTNNAIKFTKKGYVQINVEMLSSTINKSLVCFKVQDTGIGIEADKVKNIYDRFFQANADNTRIYGGTGLGLAITKKLLELMVSEIHVRTSPEKGSCFSFIIAFDNGKAEALANLKLSANLKEDKLTNLRILVVEDNKMNKILIEKFLKKWEAEADFAINGVEAIAKVSEKEYDIILMDLQMPEIDGYQATTIIRQELKKNMPIIALTADVLFNADKHINKNEFTDYVLKPFNPKFLYNKICKHTYNQYNHI